MKKEIGQLETALDELHKSNDVTRAAYSTLKFAVEQVKNCNILQVSDSLPTDDELGEIVDKIAYTQQEKEQADDFVNKIWLLKYFIEKHFKVKF